MAIAVKRATLFIVLAGSFLIVFAFVRDPHDSFRFIKTLLFRAEAIMLVGIALAWLPSPSPWRNSKHSSAVPRLRTCSCRRVRSRATRRLPYADVRDETARRVRAIYGADWLP